MAITREQARRELARRELARRETMKREETPSMAGGAWNALTVPAQKSSEGLNKVADMYSLMQTAPTGNKVKDIALNAIPIMGESGMRTLGKVAPEFISRGAMVTGAVAPALGMAGKGIRAIAKPVGRWGGAQLEDLAGMVPGSLREAYRSGFGAFKGGKKAASPLYDAAKDSRGMNLFKGMYKPEEIVDKARETLSKGIQLTPTEGLSYRKAVSSLMKSGRYVKDELVAMRAEADAIAKSSKFIKEADEVHQKGMMAESLRSLLPKTAQGKSSSWKTMMAGLSGMSPLWSPIALGTGSAIAGKIGKIMSGVINQPVKSGLTAVGILNALRKRDED